MLTNINKREDRTLCVPCGKKYDRDWHRQKLQRRSISSVVCKCGCGGHVKEGDVFIHGHNLRMPETRAKMKQCVETWNNSPEGKAARRSIALKWCNSPENKANLEKLHKTWSGSPENMANLEKYRASPKGQENLKKIHEWSRSPEGIARFLKASKEWCNSPEGKAQLLINASKARAAQKIHPSSLEQRAFAIFLHYGLPFDFMGDQRRKSIGGKYPDFVHSDEKIVVEICSKAEKEFRLHKPWQQYEKERIEHFGKFGYRCIVLWDDLDDEEMVMQVQGASGSNHTMVRDALLETFKSSGETIRPW